MLCLLWVLLLVAAPPVDALLRLTSHRAILSVPLPPAPARHSGGDNPCAAEQRLQPVLSSDGTTIFVALSDALFRVARRASGTTEVLERLSLRTAFCSAGDKCNESWNIHISALEPGASHDTHLFVAVVRGRQRGTGCSFDSVVLRVRKRQLALAGRYQALGSVTALVLSGGDALVTKWVGVQPPWAQWRSG